MRFAQVKQGITYTTTYLSKIIQINNICIMDNAKRITWDGWNSGIQRGTYYPFEYQFLLDNHQYSILLSDASFFQFYYSFNKQDQLVAAKLSYYPRPAPVIESLDEFNDAAEVASDQEDYYMYNHILNWIELFDSTSKWPSNTSHIRLDYDINASSHDPSHLQFGAIQNFRIPSDFVPQPLAFVQLCKSIMCDYNDTITQNHINHARNHSLNLERTEQIISLSTLKK